MIRRAAIDAYPTQLHIKAPLSELPIRSRMLAEVSNVVRLRLIESIVVIAGMNQEDVTLPHPHFLGYVLRPVRHSHPPDR